VTGRWAYFWLTAAAIFLCDRLTKAEVVRRLEPGQSVAVIPNIFHITYVLNPGGAFGLLPGGPLFFTIIASSVAIAVVAYYFIRRPENLALNLALGLALGGALGNLFDRITIGRVVDWLDFRIWPVFNIADSALVIGLGMLSITILWGRDNEDGSRT
jgi:signal peptidase II